MENQLDDKPNITPAPPNKRLQQNQAKVDEVVDIMRINVDKVLERDKNLSKLDNRADALQAGASQFEASAGKLKRKFWWRNCKVMLALALMLSILIVVTITWIVSSQKSAKIIEKLNAFQSSIGSTTLLNNSSNSIVMSTVSPTPVSTTPSPIVDDHANTTNKEVIPDV